MDTLHEKLSGIFASRPYKAVISKQARKDAPYRKIDLERKGEAYLVPSTPKSRCFTKICPRRRPRIFASRRWERIFCS